MSDESNRFVVSLGGGGAPGLCANVALVGILEELGLQERIAEVWGTSAGAVIGGAWSSGTPARELLATLVDLSRGRVLDVPWVSLIAGMLQVPFGRPMPDGLVRGERLKTAIEACLKVRSFEECPTEFRCIACSDDGYFRTKIFRRGPLLHAILASMSIPGVFMPREPLAEETCSYYDGGLVEKTPLLSPVADHSKRGDERRLLLLATHCYDEGHRSSARGSLNRLLHSLFALEEAKWTYQLAEAKRHRFLKLMILNPHFEGTSMLDFKTVEPRYRQARAAFADTLQNAKLALTFAT